METLTIEEAIKAMVDGKEVTSDEFETPDYTYCIYDKTVKDEFPFRYIRGNINTTMGSVWNIKTWRLRKYIPKDKELVFCWNNKYKTFTGIGYYDEKYEGLYDIKGKRNGGCYDNYAPYKGELPPNMCKPEELEE